jgi:hypothetical protein
MTNKGGTLTTRGLIKHLREKNPDMPLEILAAAQAEIIRSFAEAMAAGRPVIMRGFGRLWTRRYHRSARKRLGALFRPSPKLLKRLNKKFPP